MDELINDFLAETRDMLQALAGAIVAWEAEPTDRARLDEIFRFVHTVKGNCGFFDLPRLQQLSHHAEDVLADVRAGRRSADSRLVSAVLAVIDRIGELVQALDTGEALGSEDDEQLIAALSDEGPVLALEPEAPAPVTETKKGGMRSIRLSVDLLDRMMSGVSTPCSPATSLPGGCATMSAISPSRPRSSAFRLHRRDPRRDHPHPHAADDSLFTALPRMVRDLAAELGKTVHPRRRRRRRARRR
jgi:two-component system chemotaxis sensor kinase CheA